MVINMKYNKVIPAIFKERKNRFIATVTLSGSDETVHVKNTGRCKELLVKGCKVWLSVSDNPLRKTKYDLICSEKPRVNQPPLLINLDSQIPNDAAEQWLRTAPLFSKTAVIRREYTYGNSRFDFYIEDGDRKAFLEVKGVTLEKGGVASFPDAPTERGIKHLNELIGCISEGYEAYVLFVIQMKEITSFMPNDETHKEFGDALRLANASGVKIIAMDCIITPDSIVIDKEVPVVL